VYIDPPFMVNSDFYAPARSFSAADAPALAYRDTWAGGLDEFLSMLRARLVLLRELLAETGSIYVHLDRRASHYAKILLDEIFGYECFRNEITWRRANAHSDPHRFGSITDSILFYARSARADVQPYFRDVHVPYSTEYVRSHFHKIERKTGRRYRLVPLDAPRHGDGGNLVYEWRGRWPAPTRTWAYKREQMEELEAQGRIVYTGRGTPTLRRYLDESPGLVAQSLWDDIPPVNPMARERLGYPTQKPLALLDRILRASCPPGGLVLDCFAGSGTTCEAAERAGARWIGIDSSPLAIAITRRRLVQLQGQPIPRAAGAARYRACTRCSAISRVQSSRRSGDAFLVRPFMIETLSAEPASFELPLIVDTDGRTVTIALPEDGPVSRSSLDAWSVDWHHGHHRDDAGRPLFAPGWHGVRARGPGGLEPRAVHTYAGSGPCTIAVRAYDQNGRVGGALLTLDL
jgi:DNA modification methylase